MTVKELGVILEGLDQNQEIVIQKNENEGFMLCEVEIWPKGHIGFNGPIIMLGEQICFDSESKVSKRE